MPRRRRGSLRPLRRFARRLASTTELHFEKTPLEKAVACIAGRHKLQIRLDNTALAMRA